MWKLKLKLSTSLKAILPAMQETQVQPLGREDPLEKEMYGNSFQYYCLENIMDRGNWRAKVHGVAKNSTQLGN